MVLNAVVRWNTLSMDAAGADCGHLNGVQYVVGVCDRVGASR